MVRLSADRLQVLTAQSYRTRGGVGGHVCGGAGREWSGTGPGLPSLSRVCHQRDTTRSEVSRCVACYLYVSHFTDSD